MHDGPYPHPVLIKRLLFSLTIDLDRKTYCFAKLTYILEIELGLLSSSQPRKKMVMEGWLPTRHLL